MRRLLMLTIFPLASLALQIALAQSTPPQQHVRVEKNVFISDAPAHLKLTLDANFQYLGSFSFDIKGIAGGYRYVWGEIGKDKHLERTFIIQAEGYYPGNSGTYKYGAPNPATLAGETYQHNVWIYDNDESARESPGNESDLTRKFMQEKGWVWEPQLVMSRFARVVDESKKNEIIFFYYENLKTHTKKRVADFPEEGASAEQESILSTVDANSRKAFTVER